MAKPKNEIGNIYGKLTVVSRYDINAKNGEAQWLCECECGKQIIVAGSKLRGHRIKSCGCAKQELVKYGCEKNGTSQGRKYKDISNQRFGKLIAQCPTSEKRNNSIIWICKCDCGNICEVSSRNLVGKNTQSCGCLKSKGESSIQDILIKNNINFVKEYNVQINGNNRRYDFAIIDNNQIIRLIEFDGPQHTNLYDCGYYTVEMCQAIQQRDKEKNEYAKIQNIPLVRIPYELKDKITLETLLSDTYLVQ